MNRTLILIFCLIISLTLKAQTSKTLNVTAGTLASTLTTTELQTITSLTLTGTIDARDFKTMRDKMPLLANLDLDGVTIVAFGYEGTSSGGGYNNSANAIPGDAFSIDGSGKTSLTSVVLPSSLTAIGYSSFQRCSGLKNMIIPSLVTSIGAYAFQSCQNLTSVFIPSSVTSIETGAFNYCNGLTSITVGCSLPPDLSNSHDVFYSVNKLSCILHVPFGTALRYKMAYEWKDFKNIVEAAEGFCLSSNNVSVAAGEGSKSDIDIITNINWTAKSDQTWLTVNPSSGTGTNQKLTFTSEANPLFTPRTATVTVSATGVESQMVTITQERKIQGAKACEVIAGGLSSALTSIELNTITDLTLTGIIDARDFKTMRDNMPLLARLDLTGATIVAYNGTEGTSQRQTVVYPANTIPENAFVMFPFNGKPSLTYVRLPSSLTSIGREAFYGCLIKDIIIPTSVSSIGVAAFCSCALPAINIPGSVSDIGYGAFWSFGGLITVDPDNKNFSSTEAVLFNKAQTELIQCPNTKSGNYTIPSSVTSIGESAFYNNYNLTSVTIPSSVTSIGKKAFWGCFNMTTATLPSSISFIGDGAFESCNKLATVTIPSSLTSIGANVFRLCQSLTALNIPSSVTTIGANAFSECDGLKTLTLGSSITSIGEKAFYKCYGLTTLTIPTSVTSIGSMAFNGCLFLTKIVIPSSVNSIGDYAFNQCSIYGDLYVYSVSPINFNSSNIIFSNTTEGRLYVPAGSKFAYQSANVWKDFRNIVEFDLGLVANAGPNQEVTEGTLVTLDGSASKSNISANPLTYKWTVPPGITLSSTNVANPTFTAPGVAWDTPYTFSLVVNDGTTNSNAGLVVITVKHVNRIPIANAGMGQTVYTGELVTLDGTGSKSSITGNTLTYRWTAPVGITLSSETSSKPTFTAPEVSPGTRYEFSLVVNDGTANSEVSLTAVVVYVKNSLPIANAGIDQFVNRGETVTLDGTASIDPEGKSLHYHWTAPEGITLSSTIASKPTFTAPQVLADQSLTFKLSVTDERENAYSVWDFVVVTVRFQNHTPIAIAGTDQLVNGGETVTLDGTASIDTDGNNLSYLWTAPSGITLSSATATKPTFTAPQIQSDQNYTFSLVVKDGTSSSTTDQVVITVKQVNNTPVANAGADQSINEGSLMTLDGSLSSDPDGTPITYLWTAPAGITLSSVTAAKPTFTAPEVQLDQNYTFSLVVKDGTSSSTTDQVVVTVKQINKAPIANAGADQSINEGSLATLDGSLSFDPDGNPITYQWTAPAGITLSSATAAKPTFTAPQVQSDQNYTFSLVVSNATVSSPADQVVITVKQVNKAPIANAGTDQSTNEGTLLTLDGSLSSDPDGNPITYLWTAPTGITLSSNTAQKPTFTAPEVSVNTNYTFSLVVNDGTFSSTADQVVITVKQVNKAPVANAGADQSVNEGTSVTLDGSFSSDPDGNPITYLWTAAAGITLSSTTAQKPTFTAPQVQADQNYTFSLVVSDGTLSSTVDQVVITIKQVNKAPVANAGADQSVNEGSLVTLDGSLSTDADGNPITHLWTAPAGITLSSVTAAIPTFTAPEVTQDTQYFFTLVVSDGQLNSVASKVVVTVKQIPTILRLTSKANNSIIPATEVNYHLFLKTENGFSEKNISQVTNGAATQFSIEPGEWIVLASPVQNSTLFVSTYIGNVLKWEDAEHMVISDKANISKEISCFVPERANVGLGQISGYVYQGSGTKSSSITKTFFESGNPIPGPLIQLYKKGSTIPVLSIFTDSKGYFQFDRLEIADYEIKVELPGFTQSEKFDIALSNEKPLNTAYFKVNMTSLVITNNSYMLSTPIKIYPNPTKGVVNITGLNSNGQNRIAIYTIEGKSLKKKTTGSAIETIDISDQTPGIYIMTINNQTFKVCKE